MDSFSKQSRSAVSAAAAAAAQSYILLIPRNDFGNFCFSTQQQPWDLYIAYAATAQDTG